MAEKWKKLGSRTLQETKIFRLREDTCVSPRNGGTWPFYVLEMPDWINVVAIDNDGNVIFIRQFRHGTGEVTLEIPGGTVDPGETPLQAAVRELREETGYVARRWIELGFIEPNPAIQTNRCWTFLAQGCSSEGPAQQDEREEIEVELRPLEQVGRMLADGSIHHALVAVAFQKLNLMQRGLLPIREVKP